MDITFGTIPMIIITIQGYCLIRDFASEYKNLNQRLRSVLRDIRVAASLFKYAVNKLLEDLLDDETRRIMLEDLMSEHWNAHNLESQLEGILGDSFEIIRDCISRAQETVQDIKKILLLLSGSTMVQSKNEFPFERLAKGVAVIATSFLRTDPLHLRIKNIQIQSSRKKLASLAKDYRGDLQRLHKKLAEQNREFIDILELAPWKSNPQSTGIKREFPPHQLDGHANGDTPTAPLHPRVIQRASQRLYWTVSQTLICECHSLHLRLDQVNETPLVKGVKGKLKEPPQLAAAEPYFSFQLTSYSHSYTHKTFSASSVPIQLSFTNYSSKAPDSITVLDTSKRSMCEELVCLNGGYEGYVKYSSESTNSGFMLRRVADAKAASNTPPISLDDLLRCQASVLSCFDCLLIAANLSHTLLHHYSSPWISDWTIQTIQYFEKLKPTSNIGSWIPHVSIKRNGSDIRQFGVRNREVHALGLILLQIGQKSRLEAPQAEEERVVLEKALRGLSRHMGPDYRNFVKNCLVKWSDRGTDLMEDGNFNEFLTHVKLLEKQAHILDSD